MESKLYSVIYDKRGDQAEKAFVIADDMEDAIDVATKCHPVINNEIFEVQYIGQIMFDKEPTYVSRHFVFGNP